MAAEMFDELYSMILLLFPKLHVAILTSCDDKVCPETQSEEVQ